MTLCEKFRQAIHPWTDDSPIVRALVLNVLDSMAETHYEVDLSMSGLFKEHCRQQYPSKWVIQECVNRGIGLVYGSDAHAVDHVGRGYEEMCCLVPVMAGGSE